MPTNVTRITRALNHRDQNGIPQVAFYQRGVGTDGDEEDELVGGLSGDDISEHIREAYAFLANNFDPESQEDVDDPSKPMDEIVILGFSRGAYTARAIATLITDVGLLTKKGMEDFWGIFGDWMKQDVKGNESEWFKSAYGKFVPFTDPEYRGTLIKVSLDSKSQRPHCAQSTWCGGFPQPSYRCLLESGNSRLVSSGKVRRGL